MQNPTTEGLSLSMFESQYDAYLLTVVNHLVEALESGQSEVLAQYLSTMARFHNYSFLCY